MSNPSLIDLQRPLLHALAELNAERHQVDPALAERFRGEMNEATAAYDDLRRKHERRRTKRLEAIEEEIRGKKAAVEARYITENERSLKHHGKARFELTSLLDAEVEAAKAMLQEAQWTAEAFLEGARADADKQLREQRDRVAEQMAELASLAEQAETVLEERELPQPTVPAAKPPAPSHTLDAAIAQTGELLTQLRGLTILRQLNGQRLFGLVFLVGLVLIYPLGWAITTLLGREGNLALLLACGGTTGVLFSVGVGFLFLTLMRQRARREVERIFVPLMQQVKQAEQLRDAALDHARRSHTHFLDTTQQRYADEQDLAKRRHVAMQSDIAQRRVQGLAGIDQRLKDERQTSEERRTRERDRLDRQLGRARKQIDQRYEQRLKEIEAEYQAQREAILGRYQGEWQSYRTRWEQTLQQAQQDAGLLAAGSNERFPEWEAATWSTWQPPTNPEAPAFYRFGSYLLPAQSIVAEPPWEDTRPRAARCDVFVPALCPLAEPQSVIFHAEDEGRDKANEALRAMLFRMLTGMPPGRIRFLIVDPVGLGQNFGAFMNLADHDEKLVSSRIWTETAHIEQRLADLTGHMENVIQKYLRNRYATIAEYNAQAGEVAEPYRVLVIANFPVNFSVEAIRRLVSIAQSGSRCGVSLLMSVDRKQPLPKGCELADLERHGLNLDWAGGRFTWRDEILGKQLLTLDAPPPEELGNRLLQQIGERARDAQRVQVPFEFILPPVEQYWRHDSRQGLRVPLGRAGATRRQCLDLGKGTSQHVLLAGKTGSGKSTLLHALIVNLALLYNPDEVELYLVDFKKGVEFKTYALHHLPHARVVAIESEREFGLSVLQRLDTEITQRGETFRAANVQDVNAYREAVPGARMPRILLIVDEFQEFFVEDDRIGQEAARLLDRLVRQGRAFGIHVLLGSQTIGGAYSLARSTIDQMAVRIALQCSEADAHLILSDDNSAARLLSRPGEAIYNDANGRVEGNDPFQVVWLGEDQRERYLDQVRLLSEQRPAQRDAPMVVFEGNAIADLAANAPLRQLLTNPVVAEESERGEEAWLGEAMAIDQLTTATFRRQNGSHLILVGQQTDAALGILASTLVSLAAHAVEPPTSGGRFLLIDGQQAEIPRTGWLPRLAEALGPVLRLTGTRELGPVLTELNAELARRQAAPDEGHPSLYLVLVGAQRMRDLRRPEDDFGMFGKSEAPATPDRHLATLVREGPVFGIHVVLWCDTLANLQRLFDRQLMRELTMRVVFQMNVADSGNLIDSPAASKLGLHRALYCNEEEGRLEKFRPYGLPSETWLTWVRETLRTRAAQVAAPSVSTPG
ncbi:MAG: FtsK/SpoIIIE domain-containing protein [Gemmataceae bacterium]